MKTILFFICEKMKKFWCVLIILIIILMCTKEGESQTWTNLAKVAPPSASEIVQYDNFRIKRLGVGDDFMDPILLVPQAKFHMREMLTIDPVSLYEVKDAVGDLGSIKNLFIRHDSAFGIYQTGYNFLNIFEGTIGSQTGLLLNGENTSISVIKTDPLPFHMAGSPSGPMTIPMELYRNRKVKIMDTLECNNLLLHYNSGLGKVIVSDQKGNGIWTDPSSLVDGKWVINGDNDLYAHPERRHVGIGFRNPEEKIYQMLHIVDGNILISRLHDNNGNPCSVNGSILFSDVVNENCPNGKWGVEYYNGGLNFWQIYCQSKGASSEDERNNYVLFLKDDQTVGIGTENTFGYKLAVNGSIICEDLKVKRFSNWPDYVLKDDYKLIPLNEVERFINENHHLPGVPSAREITKNGINIGDINSILVKKVEELTKYIIEQQKQIDELKSKVENR